jgi:tetratricopeptide (TPR) repeat protein
MSPETLLRFMTINLLREKRYREAVLYGTKLLRGAYGDPQLHAVVAEAYRNLGDLTRARNHYQRAIEKDRSSLELRYGLLEVLWQAGEYADVQAESARLLQKDRGDSTAGYFHSLALSRTGASIQQVLAELQQQVKARGPDPVLMAELGHAYARGGMPELAEGWLARSLRLSGPSPSLLLALSDVYEALGKPGQVAEAIRSYLGINPEDHEVRRRLVRVLLGQDAFGEAADQITRVLAHDSSNPRLKATLAVCYRRTGKYPEALIILRELLVASPAAEEHLKAAVYCLDRMGARQVATKALESFMREHGESLSLLLMLGVLQYQDKALESSSATFRRAVALSPSDWRAHRNLGMVYRRMKNDVFAEKFLARAAELRERADPGGAE